jgi:DNA-binding cell septation regulator SpoVG
MQITEIHIHPLEQPRQGLVAFAHIVLDESLLLGSIGIHMKLQGGYRLTYPKKNQSTVFHPITSTLGRQIERAVTEKAKIVLGKNRDRYHRIEPSSS